MEQEQIKVGIIGYGVIGSTFGRWLKEYTKCQVAVSDPPKGINDDLTGCSIFFIGIHIPTEADGSQDLTLLKSIIRGLPQGPVVIRTTMLPGTCDGLTKELGREVIFMPEFLTERTAYVDFCNQDVVIAGARDILDSIFASKKRLYMSNIEAEITKYAHNVFGAVAVTYFNGIYELCGQVGADYEKVRDGFLLSGYIAPTHTHVPGPDGKTGYGGKCFPKDVNAFAEYNHTRLLGDLLKLVARQNDYYRNKKEA